MAAVLPAGHGQQHDGFQSIPSGRNILEFAIGWTRLMSEFEVKEPSSGQSGLRQIDCCPRSTVATGLLSRLRGYYWYLANCAEPTVRIEPSVRCQNRHGSIKLGNNVCLGRRVYLEAVGKSSHDLASLQIGDNSVIHDNCRIMAVRSIKIGAECVVGWNCVLLDSDRHDLSYDGVAWEPRDAAITLEEHVWLGCNVTVLKGVRIGAGAVVAAGSIVSRDVPGNVFAAGIPAKPIRSVASWR